MDTTSGIGLSTESDDTMNEDTPVVVASAVKEVVTPSVVDMTLEKEKRSSLDDTTVLESSPPLPTNTWSKYGLARSMFSSSTDLFSFQFSSMEGLDAMLENGPWFIRNNPLIWKKWHPDENLLKEDVSIVPVWVKLHGVLVTAFSDDGLSVIATKLGTPLMLDSYTSDMCMQFWGRSSYARVIIEFQANMELKDNIIMAMPRIKGEGHYICNVCVDYEWKPHRPALKKPTANSSSNKKKDVVPSIEVSNVNPFEVLNSVDNDMELGTNRGTTNLVNNEAISSGFSLINIDNSSIRTTPIIDKIRKFKELLTSGKATKYVFDGTTLEIRSLELYHPNGQAPEPLGETREGNPLELTASH
ncbi:hypothetical protein Tco_0286431 [Tanacetum coccineum]